MIGPFAYDLARQRIAEWLQERAMDRLAAQVPREARPWAPRIDSRRPFRQLRPRGGSAQARA
jgi:hypothetical protein